MSTSRIGISETLIIAGVGHGIIFLANGALSDLVRRLVLLVKESPKYEDGAEGENDVDFTNARLLLRGFPNSEDRAGGEDVDSTNDQVPITATIERMGAFEELPEGCIATILSRTTPVDAVRLSLVSKTFLFASDSDTVWNHFLLSNSQFINSIISRSPSLANAPTKKALYLALCNRPIIIDHARKSFQLDRKSGKKCYMLAARALTINCGNVPLGEKKWIRMKNSRFPKVAKLCYVSWLEIRGMINTLSLSPNTKYAAYLVFKDACGFESTPVKLSVGVEGGHCSTKFVCLKRMLNIMTNHNCAKTSNNKIRCKCLPPGWITRRTLGLKQPSVRIDGWLEIEMGEFFNSSLEDEEVQMSVIMEGGIKKKLSLQGIEVRPKKDN